MQAGGRWGTGTRGRDPRVPTGGPDCVFIRDHRRVRVRRPSRRAGRSCWPPQFPPKPAGGCCCSCMGYWLPVIPPIRCGITLSGLDQRAAPMRLRDSVPPWLCAPPPAPRQKCKADYGSDQPAYLAALGHPDFGAFIRFGRFCPSLWRVARRCLCPVGLDFSLIAHSSRYDCSLIA